MHFDRLQRREFITLLGGAAVSSWISPLQALAQALDNVPRRIGFVSGASYTATAKNVAAFLEGMRAHSYVEGRDFEMDYRWAEGHLARVSTLVEELVRSKPDLILATIVQAAVAASDAIKAIPIVCPLLVDPVRLGLIKSDARPGGNVTGLRMLVEGLTGKQLELVLDLIPHATKIGLVVNPDNANSLIQRRELEAVVAATAITIVSAEARTPEQVDFDLPDVGERAGRCGYRASGFDVQPRTRKNSRVGNRGAVAGRLRVPRARRRWWSHQLRDQPA